ncbi:hypothetical protein PWT90_08370 [Aphanocladium album]|nr:hypothetical protein PWT90_08370 [Aphanocladium album]
MKTAAAAIILAATLVAAEPQHAMPTGTKINCAKPNASYCMGGDIILRCGADSTGQPGRCSDNVSGYPPAGGIAECWESSRDAGDAACQKNCVVYADKPFTLAADKCTPSGTQTGTSAPPTSTSTGTTSTTTTSTPITSSTLSHSSSTATLSTTTTTQITTLSPPPPGTGISTSTHGGNSTVTTPPVSSSGGSIITKTTTVGGKPTTTPPANPNNAAANGAMGGLLALGLAVAALF